MSNSDDNITELAGITPGTLRDGEESTWSTSGDEHNSKADNRSNDAGRSANISSSSSGDAAKSSGQSGSAEGVNDSEDAATQYEGVTGSDFADFSDLVVSKVDGILACNVVLIFALFICAGTLVINEVIVSMRGK